MLTPYKDAIPNVIMLPYERAPPLHIKAPNWRDLLTLMARLSGSRLEPTLEAITVVKTTMHLRVVVNFVKVRLNNAAVCDGLTASHRCTRPLTIGMSSCT